MMGGLWSIVYFTPGSRDHVLEPVQVPGEACAGSAGCFALVPTPFPSGGGGPSCGVRVPGCFQSRISRSEDHAPRGNPAPALLLPLTLQSGAWPRPTREPRHRHSH